MKLYQRLLAAQGLIFAICVGATASQLHSEEFEDPGFAPGAPITTPSANWNSYNSPMARVGTGTDGIPSHGGLAHAKIDTTLGGLPSSPEDYTGIFSRLGGYSANWNGGFSVRQAVYLDPLDPSCATSLYAFDISAAASNPSGGHRRDFIFHAAGYPGSILVAASNNSNFTRRNDLGTINHYVVTTPGWYIFEWVFRQQAGTLHVDCNLRDSGGVWLWTETRNDVSDIPNVTVGGNRYVWFTFFEGMNSLAIDDTELDTNGSDYGLPVDLSGNYQGINNDYFNPPYAGVCSATTNSAGSRIDGSKVVEASQTTAAVEGTYTPFSDATKPPKTLDGLDMRGKRYQFDIDLGDPNRWIPNIDWFQVGTGRQADALDYQTEEMFCYIWRGDGINGSSANGRFQLYPSSEWYMYATGSSYYNAAADESRFRVTMEFESTGTQATMSVMPLNGANAGALFVLPAFTLDGYDDVTNTSFFAGFSNNDYLPSKARATISNFTTSAAQNWLYAYAQDPWVKPTQNIGYDFGMANLAQPMAGFQAFGAPVGPATLINLGSADPYYTVQPFPIVLLDPRFTGLAAGVPLGGATGVSNNALLAFLPYSTTVEGTHVLGIAPNNGNPLIPTRFSGVGGGSVLANRLNSNVVVIDGTNPTLSSLTATQNNVSVLGGSPQVIQGTVTICINAADLGAFPSGLDDDPTIDVDFAPAGPSLGDINGARMSSLLGNTFCYDVAITSSTPCGVATITTRVTDRSGNNATPVTGTLNINVATVTLTIVLDSTDNNLAGTITRGIQIKLGGNPSTGTNPPFYANRDIAFTDPDGAGPLVLTGLVTLTALDGVPCGKQLNAVSAKDPKHTLRKLVSLTAGPMDQYTATLHLRGGDCTGAISAPLGGTIGDNLIDILDYGLFAFQYNQSLGSNTPLGFTGGHSDFSGNGTVGTNDFTFVGTGFLLTGDSEPGNFSDGGGDPLSTCTVRQMVKAGVPLKIAEAYDSNKDGIITVQEIQKWLNNGGRSG